MNSTTWRELGNRSRPMHCSGCVSYGHLLCVILATALPVLWSSSATGQELKGLRDTVRRAGAPKAKARDDDDHDEHRRHSDYDYHDHHHHDDENDFELWAGLGVVIGTGLTAPFWGPVAILDDDYDVPGYFPTYPYKGQLEGHMMFHPWLPEEPFPWSSRASVEYADSFNDVANVNTKLLFESTKRWGIDSEIGYRTEKLQSGFKDDLFVGDLNVVYRFAQSEHWQFRSGVGVNWLTDDIDSNFGFNFTYAVDYFPRSPWVFSSELDWGKLGNSSLIHLRSTAGVLFHGGEVYIGVDLYDVGASDTTTMISGVRVWL